MNKLLIKFIIFLFAIAQFNRNYCMEYNIVNIETEKKPAKQNEVTSKHQKILTLLDECDTLLKQIDPSQKLEFTNKLNQLSTVCNNNIESLNYHTEKNAKQDNTTLMHQLNASEHLPSAEKLLDECYALMDQLKLKRAGIMAEFNVLTDFNIETNASIFLDDSKIKNTIPRCNQCNIEYIDKASHIRNNHAIKTQSPYIICVYGICAEKQAVIIPSEQYEKHLAYHLQESTQYDRETLQPLIVSNKTDSPEVNLERKRKSHDGKPIDVDKAKKMPNKLFWNLYGKSLPIQQSQEKTMVRNEINLTD